MDLSYGYMTVLTVVTIPLIYGQASKLQCPLLEPGTIGVCAEMCGAGGSCPPGQLCCSNGCGHVCKMGCVDKSASCNKVCPPGEALARLRDNYDCPYCECIGGGPSPGSCSLTSCPNGYYCTESSSSVACKECPPVCEIACLPGEELKKDARGCSVCECVDKCENLNCGYGSKCEVGFSQEAECSQCTVMSCNCPQNYGIKVDKNGCADRCECFDVCEDYTCPLGQVCDSVATPCAPGSFPCNPVPICKPGGTGGNCDDRFCPACPRGEVPLRGSDGCQVNCQCFNPCAAMSCIYGTTCVLEQVQCVTTPCDPVPVCKEIDMCYDASCPLCPQYEIPVRDSQGCRYNNCQCYDPCTSVRCEDDEACTLEYVWCVSEPCDPVPVCKRYPVSSATKTRIGSTIHTIVLGLFLLYTIII